MIWWCIPSVHNVYKGHPVIFLDLLWPLRCLVRASVTCVSRALCEYTNMNICMYMNSNTRANTCVCTGSAVGTVGDSVREREMLQHFYQDSASWHNLAVTCSLLFTMNLNIYVIFDLLILEAVLQWHSKSKFFIMLFLAGNICIFSSNKLFQIASTQE